MVSFPPSPSLRIEEEMFSRVEQTTNVGKRRNEDYCKE
jgi:hypothetical protein